MTRRRQRQARLGLLEQTLRQAARGAGFFGFACNDCVRHTCWIHGPLA